MHLHREKDKDEQDNGRGPDANKAVEVIGVSLVTQTALGYSSIGDRTNTPI